MEMDLKAWARLYEEDPALFERRKQQALEAVIAESCSPQTLRRLLERIQTIDSGPTAPEVAYGELLRILRTRLGDGILPALARLGEKIDRKDGLPDR